MPTPAPAPAVKGSPNIVYTDTLSAPTKGGENGQGGYLSIFGSNFGSASGLGSTTKVLIGGVPVANYRYLGAAKVGSKIGLQQLIVQVGSLNGATVGQALPITVVVNGVASNTNTTFTPTSGKVLFVSLSGNDSTAAANDVSKPYRYLQNGSSSGAYYAMGAGDQVVIRGGNWSDANGIDGTWMRASLSSSARNGNANAWIHITGYPNENVNYTTPAGKPGGIQGPWQAIAGTSGEYWAISNLHIAVSGQANADAAPLNTQYLSGNWRIVNNELGPWPVSGVDYARAAGVAGSGENVKLLGNHIHDIAGTSALENHGVYVDGGAKDWELAYNWIHDITGGSIVQFNDAKGLGGSFKMPKTGATWMGFTGMKVHNNWLENGAKYGLNISDVGSVGATVVEAQAYNNVIIGTKLPAFRMSSSAKSIDATFAYNTIYNAMVSNSGSGNGFFRNEWNGSGNIRIYNNILSFGGKTVSGTNWFYDYSGSSSGWTFKNNLYWDMNRGVAAPSSDTSKVVGDPMFTNAAANDLTLQSSSPAIGKAVQSLPFSIISDLTGALLRTAGAVADLGALERQ